MELIAIPSPKGMSFILSYSTELNLVTCSRISVWWELLRASLSASAAPSIYNSPPDYAGQYNLEAIKYTL